jgi:endonuclease YncB( thermonuclease family)
MIVGAGSNPGTPTQVKQNVNLAIIRAGWSPYWRKYGPSPDEMHKAYLQAQEEAETAKAGAWATVPQWMKDKANETTAPKTKAKE